MKKSTPLTPDQLIGAKHDKVHYDLGKPSRVDERMIRRPGKITDLAIDGKTFELSPDEEFSIVKEYTGGTLSMNIGKDNASLRKHIEDEIEPVALPQKCLIGDWITNDISYAESLPNSKAETISEWAKLEINRTYYAIRSKKTGLFYNGADTFEWSNKPCLYNTEDEARRSSEKLTDIFADSHEPVEIVELRLVCQETVREPKEKEPAFNALKSFLE